MYYFGMNYTTKALNGNEIENGGCRLYDAYTSKGRVIIPSKVSDGGKDYIVRQFGRDDVARRLGKPSDNRIKDISKFPRIEIGRYSPFTSNHSLLDNSERALPPNTTVTYVKLPETINVLGEGSFRRCHALEEVELSKNITVIPDDCFLDCKSLKTIRLHEGITEIGRSAFSHCTALTEITIPSSVTKIMGEAFSGCAALTEITIPSSVTEIGSSAFGDGYKDSNGLKVVNILNDEGEVMMFPDSFTDRVKINYLGKKSAKKTSDSKPAKESAKATTIDLEKLIQAALVDGTVTDKERAILIKKVKEAGGDTDEFEILLDARIFEANKKTAKTEKPKAEVKTTTKEKSAAKAEKPAKEQSPKGSKTPVGDYKKSATCGDYFIGIQNDAKVFVSKDGSSCDNTKAALREVAEKVGFEVDPKWNTQQFGSKLVDFLNGKK